MNDWQELESPEVRFWIGEAEVGLWCDRCLLPSAWRAPVESDPAMPSGTYTGGCTEHSSDEP